MRSTVPRAVRTILKKVQFDTDLIDIIDGVINAAVYAMSYVESYTTLIAFMRIYGTAYYIDKNSVLVTF